MSDKKKDIKPAIATVLKSNKKVIVGVFAVAVVIVLSLFTFSKMNIKKETTKEDSYAVESESVAPMADPATPEPVANVSTNNQQNTTPTITKEELVMLVEKQKELQQRLSAPLMAVTNNASDKPVSEQEKAGVSSNPNTRFMQEASERKENIAIATSIGSLNSMIAQGNFIHAILESASNSDLPGSLRAVVSEPSYSEDGSRVLIPRGSRLIGEYKSGILQGQTRVFVVWTRLITPDGLSVQLGSPGVDGLGVAGMQADSIGRHFWERFGMASLLSVIGAGTANVGVTGNDQNNSASMYRSAVASSFSQSANESLQQDAQMAPTLKTQQGKPIMVFVARDLQFADAIKETKPSINVF